jgi:hypothetical protein
MENRMTTSAPTVHPTRNQRLLAKPFPYLTEDAWVAENTPDDLLAQIDNFCEQPYASAIYFDHINGYPQEAHYYRRYDYLFNEEEYPDGIETWQYLQGLHDTAAYLADHVKSLETRAEESWGLHLLGYTQWTNLNYRHGHVSGWVTNRTWAIAGFGQPVLKETWNDDHTTVTFGIVGTLNPRTAPIWASDTVPVTDVAPALLEAEKLMRDKEALAVLYALISGAIDF